MKAYEAWIKAGAGKNIWSGITVLHVTDSETRDRLLITTKLIQALSQDDWEIIREKKSLVFKCLSHQNYAAVPVPVPDRTELTVTCEWEE